MGTVQKFIAGAVVLIGVYLVWKNPTGTDAVGNSLSTVVTNSTKALQGR